MGSIALFIYVLMSLTRSTLLIWCTPFVLAGAIPFPQWSFLVFAISLIGVVVGPLLVYSFPFFGGYDRSLVDKRPQKIAIWRPKFSIKMLLVCGWLGFLSFLTHRYSSLCDGGWLICRWGNVYSIIAWQATICSCICFFSVSELASGLEYERKIKIEWFAESNKEF